MHLKRKWMRLCPLTDLRHDYEVVAEPGDLRLGIGLGMAVEVAWLTLLQVAVLGLRHPNWGSYGHTNTHTSKWNYIIMKYYRRHFGLFT